MKQTAVEWQFEQLFNSFEKFNNREYSFNEYLKRNLEIREQAKEMEKQHIIDTWYDCKMTVILKEPTTADQYYEQTFKNK